MIAGFTWPGSPGTLVMRAVQLVNGATALRVDAEVVWTIPRAASEKVPAGARLLTISVHEPHRGIGIKAKYPIVLGRLPSRVASTAQIEKIVALLNERRVQQPGLLHCPLGAGGSVQLGFYASPSTFPPLAVADINTVGGKHCGGVSLKIDGMAEPELEDGSLIEEIGRALGITPAPEKPKPHHWHR
jgi:hypothetical protein